MSYKILEQNGVDNENIDGGAFNNFSAGNRDGIIGGVLAECVVAAAGNSIGISPGELIIHGIRVKLTAAEMLTLASAPAEPVRYQVIAQVEIKADKDIEFSLFVQEVAELIQEELYASNVGTYQVELARFTHDPSGSVEDISRTLDIIYGGTGGGGDFEVGNVTSHVIDANLPAEAEVNQRIEDGKTYIDFEFYFPDTQEAMGAAEAAKEAAEAAQAAAEKAKDEAVESEEAAANSAQEAAGAESAAADSARAADASAGQAASSATAAEKSAGAAAGSAQAAQESAAYAEEIEKSLEDVDLSKYEKITGFSLSNAASGWYHVCDIDVSSLDSDDAYDGIALLSFPSGENNALVRIAAPVEEIRNNQTANVWLECFAGALTNGTYGFTVSNQAIQLYMASNENQSFTLTVLSEATYKKGRLKDSLITATNDYSTAPPAGIVYGEIRNSAKYDDDNNYITDTYVPVIEKDFTPEQQEQARENIGAAATSGTYPDMTVGKAQTLAKMVTVATTSNSAQYGWWRFASLPFSTLTAITGTSSYSAILLVNSINPVGIDNTNAIQSGLIELELRLDGGEPTAISINDVMKVLCGGLSLDMFCCSVSDTEIEFYVYLNAAYNRRNFTVLDEVYYNGEHIDALEFESTFVSSSAPSGAIYAVNRNCASYDGEGNEIATKYVTTDTAQTVSGQKTFSSPVNIAASGNVPLTIKNIPEGGYKDLIFDNDENTRIAGIRVTNNLDDDDPNVTIMLGNNGPNNAAPSGITVRRNGSTTTAEAPVPPANDDSVKIATTSWVRDVVPGIKVNNATNADNASKAGTAEELTNVSIIRSGNATTNAWYKIAEITNVGTNGDASLLLLVNGTHEPQSSQWASPTGMIEFDARNQSGSLYAAASLNFGNIPTQNVYAKINGSTAELWYKFDQGYEAVKVTVQSWNHNTIASCSFELFSNVSQASAPTGGSNAVPRMGTNKIWYGTCTTPAATAEKAVTCAGFTLEQGSAILVRMTNQHNSNSNAQLNVNGTGAALIYEKNSLLINNNNHTSWRPTDYCFFVYDGTYWVYVNSYSHNMYRSGTTLYINTCGDTQV